MRASLGSAGIQSGLMMATAKINNKYKPTSIKPGYKAPWYISPTERPNWSASTINTKDGGKACAKVPEALMVPVAMARLYPYRNMMGKEIKPMEITAAATTPVVAANKAPTSTTATAKPPRTGPNTCATVSSSSSAIRLRSRIIPMRVKNGMANKVSLDMMPNTRSGKA